MLDTFLTLILYGGEQSASHPSHFSGTHWIRVWVGSRAGLDVVAKRTDHFPAPDGKETLVIQPTD
jgi:hypothetical protein